MGLRERRVRRRLLLHGAQRSPDGVLVIPRRDLEDPWTYPTRASPASTRPERRLQ